ncbi:MULTISPECIES: SDR family oxidoreductase [unclassified Hyphomonas]|jgi:NAD(P)-dependent dehydrogenase (short-subunit alcohol dehydrogenase family)|uniref:SDR family oxidoreductase n=1 Tax=unclassified Hyphomonas TaxID=2630699 RepID=UPI000C3BED14|nr:MULTISPECIES: SDR family oxidoreductase [unclassified Hyphomonas]MAN89979.1 short-chain dehydrogenase [Hyphomonadaceae bacterium]MAL44870.1 short-chain dehydrogenase [Hyphomonas sp.]MAX83911.1 short-chain dehydrogenase [Hyphomonas sp.]HAO36920.1 short-chain dehydrogenase [Hyphomonas sp.]HAQ78296.1 short-chain dehydrogenase [Hyphomonas sp.]|tara:strand:+ start:789 stop:1649 length:861 start_codon:yes stop_codon:yes gene_type:complete
MKTVVITGASTGIGEATALYLAKHGWRVYAGVRKQSDADALSASSEGDIRPLILDVTRQEHLETAVRTVSETLKGETLTGLVNNAGIANMGPLAIQPLDDFKAHFEVNVFGLLRASQAFAPLLGMDKTRTGAPGRIVNITSVGGRISAPFLGAYTATKHAVEAMTDTLRRELVIFGIDAIAVGPGSVKTPIWDKAEEANSDGPYSGSAWSDALKQFEQVMLKGGRDGLPPEQIAKVIEIALEDATPRARYSPVPNKLTNWYIPTLLPKRVLDGVFRKRFGMTKPGK